MRPRGDCDSDDLWEPQRGSFVTMEVLTEGPKHPLGFDLSKKKKKKRKANKRRR